MICEICRKQPASQIHHKFPDTKPNRKKYSIKLINHKWNTQWACADCNSSHARARNIDERKFCSIMKILKCIYCYYDFGEKCVIYDRSLNQDAKYCRDFKFDLKRYREIKFPIGDKCG